MKRQFISFFGILLTLVFIAGAQAYPTEWISESRDYAVGEQVGDWKVLEYKDAVSHNSNGIWTVSGYASGDTRPNGATMMYFFYPGNSATVQFGTQSTAIAFMLDADDNDRLVNFYVDGTEILHHYNMWDSLPETMGTNWKVGTFVVSGLDYGYHTVKIQSAPDYSEGGRNDFHMYGAAAVEFAPPPAVPLPAAVWLLGSGLIGMAALRKRFKK